MAFIELPLRIPQSSFSTFSHCNDEWLYGCRVGDWNLSLSQQFVVDDIHWKFTWQLGCGGHVKKRFTEQQIRKDLLLTFEYGNVMIMLPHKGNIPLLYLLFTTVVNWMWKRDIIEITVFYRGSWVDRFRMLYWRWFGLFGEKGPCEWESSWELNEEITDPLSNHRSGKCYSS